MRLTDHTQGSSSVAKVTLAGASRPNIHQPPALIKPGANSHLDALEMIRLDLIVGQYLGGKKVEDA